jgi:hypothetical protein
VVRELPYKQLPKHVYGLIVFPGPAAYSNPYSNPPTGCKASNSLAAFAMLWFNKSLIDIPPRVLLTVLLGFKVLLTMLS